MTAQACPGRTAQCRVDSCKRIEWVPHRERRCCRLLWRRREFAASLVRNAPRHVPALWLPATHQRALSAG
jgi:hypothetical protein